MKHIGILVALMLAWALTGHATTDFEQACAGLNEQSLPLVNLTLDVSQMSKENYIDGHFEIADPQCRTTGDTIASFNCRLRWRGSSSLAYDKKSLAVKIVDNQGEELDVNMLGIRLKDNWILDAMAVDRLRMRNRVLFDLWNEINRTPWSTDYDRRNGTLGHFVELYFNGNYQGLYCLTDKIDRKLLNLKKAKVNNAGDVTVRGLLYKCKSHTKASYLSNYDGTASVNTIAWNGYELKVPEDYPSIATWQPLMDIIDTTRTLEPEQLIERYQDFFYRDNLIDYMVFILTFRIADNSLKNTYLSTPDITKDKRFIITPWDLDASLGNSYNGDWTNELTAMKYLYTVLLYYKLYYFDPDFNQAFKERWRELRQSHFTLENLEDKLNAYADLLMNSGAWCRERAKWNNNPVSMLADVHDEVNIVTEWFERNVTQMNTILGTPWDDLPVSIAPCLHGTIMADRDIAAEGDIVTLTITPDPNYSLDGLTIDDGKRNDPVQSRAKMPVPYVAVDDQTFSFTMPSSPVIVTATFSKNNGVEDIETRPVQCPTCYYDLSGRFVGSSLETLDNGLYLTGDGKKVILRR